ncbi:hypothetical protein MCOR02_002700 [Pyricularia oryzae]|nr:hypothetical protein MCOR02_002700 [Pyricularia oryzae]KAI6467400.1 hypothetical protein MCOR17_004463 [Pyricularia oryzae]KAI6496973.1 hypothetical protein MCOR13_006871 [Pyricularia oryzae]KAI6634614.1 hypothetical protein MCOR14_006130 [Pyricularia oryzae]
MTTDWSKNKVVDLRAELTRRGLATNGLKQELVDRLTSDDEAKLKEEPEADAPKPDDQSPPADESTDVAAEQPEAVQETATPQQAEPAQDLPNETTTEAQEIANSDAPAALLADAVGDEKKRKRRSASPPPPHDDTPRKRLRQENSDVMENGGNDADPVTSDLSQPVPATHDDEDVTMQEGAEHQAAPTAKDATCGAPPESSQKMEQEDVVDYGADSPVAQQDTEQVSSNKQESGDGDIDMKDVAKDATLQGTDQFYYDVPRARDGDDSVEPALHPATDSLFIGNFMRPLRAEVVEDHLVELAMSPGAAPDRSVLSQLWVDSIRTHALVQFQSVAAASRVRTALHGKVWPDERNRKALWVDFIPSDQVSDWIAKEKAEGSSRRGDVSRWEVVYQKEGDIMVATHQVAIAEPKTTAPPSGPNGASRAVPTGPANQYPGIESAPSGPRNMGGRRGAGDARGNGHERTRTSPSISWQPVSADLARRRLDNLNGFVSKDPNRDVGRDCHRYSFTRSDQFIDRGPEMFVGIRPPHRERERRQMGGQAGGHANGGGARAGAGGSGHGSSRQPLPPQSYEAPAPRRGPRGGGGRRNRHGGGGGGGNSGYGRYGQGGRFGDGLAPRYEDFRYRPSDNDHRSDRR